MDIKKEEQVRLVQEAVAELGFQRIYEMSLKYIDTDAIKKAGDLTQEEIKSTFVGAGFVAGLYFALENLEIEE